MSAVLRAEIEQWAKDWSDENSFDPGMEGLGELHAILDQDAILTATPTPTPPLVDMIEAALVAHRGDFHQDDWWIICKCGQQWPVGGKVHSHEAYAAFAAHQARAVLTAISEAGAVAEPNVCAHALDNQGAEFGPKSPCTKPTGHDQYHRDNTGVAFGPYQGDPNE